MVTPLAPTWFWTQPLCQCRCVYALCSAGVHTHMIKHSLLQVQDKGNGLYRCCYTTTVAGTYELHVYTGKQALCKLATLFSS